MRHSSVRMAGRPRGSCGNKIQTEEKDTTGFARRRTHLLTQKNNKQNRQHTTTVLTQRHWSKRTVSILKGQEVHPRSCPCFGIASSRALLAMDQLITKVCEKLGIEQDVAKKAVGAVLKYIQENHPQDKIDFNAIMEKLQGANELVTDYTTSREAVGAEEMKASSSSGGGLFGLIFSLLKLFGIIAMLKAFVQPIFGDSAVKLIDSVEDGADLAIVLNKLGIDREQARNLCTTLVSFMKEKLDPELVEKLLDAVPAVKAFVGDFKKEE